jgi:gliding motility-associated-like protein
MARFMRKFVLFLALAFLSTQSIASHYMGGEITWECLSNGKYKFFLKLYRECNGCLTCYQNTETLNVVNCPSTTGITMTLVSKTDISPSCNSIGPNITCTPQPSMANTGAVEEWYYTSDASYPTGVTLSGIPPAAGWIFSHTGGSRNPCTNIINADSKDWYLRAVMYSYNGQNANPCFDNSPTFAEKPSTVICTGYPFTYNHNASDKELDSLSYSWAQPFEAASSPISSYAAGYSYLSPLPGVSQNPSNIPATVNPYTGEISFTSFTNGAFVTVTKVTAYKCGIKVAEINREMQIVLLPCGNNSKPVVTAPFVNQTTGLYSEYIDTVYAGDIVTFPLSAQDIEFLPNGDPQTLHLFASGSQFGTNYTSTTSGCVNPPCAVLSPPPLANPTGLAGQYYVQTNFSWQTTCDHLATNTGCGSTSNVYNFVIKVQDDFCPAPAINISTITVVVLATPVILAPELRCAAVDASGNVTLSWVPPIDTMNSFNSYHIYTSASPTGPFTKLDSIFDYNQTSYTHTGAGANTHSVYYYLKTRSGCLGKYYSTPSDTIHSIYLNTVNSGLGVADLSWNSIHAPNLPTSMGWYRIYREYPPGTWTMIDSTQLLQYFDTITLCNALINYRIEIGDSSGCISVSNIDGDLFQDAIAPVTPVMDSVSVDSLSGYSVIGWDPSPSGDTKGYIIYENIGGIWVPIDTVFGLNTTFFINDHPLWSNPDSASLSYCVAVFDSCQNTSPISIYQNTIHLSTKLDVCGGGVTLNWSPYINMPNGLGGYKVFVSENNGSFQLLATNPSANLSYIHSPLTQFSTYIYVIQAFDNTGTITSTSNSDTVYAYTPNLPKFIYLRQATVEDFDHVRLKCYVDLSAYVSTYKVMRSDNVVGPYTQIGSVPPNGTSTITFNDFSAYVNQQSYFYKFIAVDSCGNEAIASNHGRTIYLTAEPDQNMQNLLEWNDYSNWLGSVGSYNVYRKVNDVWEITPIAELPAGTSTYTDDISTFVNTEGKFGYYVEALEGSGNPYTFADTSLSNEAFAMQPPRFYVPNAFAPKGMNNVFIPVSVFIDATDYYFAVYNRWGQMIFETSDISQGWDGTLEGQLCQQGVYVYSIKYKNSQNKFIEKNGTITLMR